MNTLRADQITIVWNNSEQKFQVIGGGLPRHTCWSEHVHLIDACTRIESLAKELGLEIIQ